MLCFDFSFSGGRQRERPGRAEDKLVALDYKISTRKKKEKKMARKKLPGMQYKRFELRGY
jgi:hypothetical protein